MSYVDYLVEFAYWAARHYNLIGKLTDDERGNAIVAREIAPDEYILECFEAYPVVDALKMLGRYVHEDGHPFNAAL